jgi:hypothetical protein
LPTLLICSNLLHEILFLHFSREKDKETELLKQMGKNKGKKTIIDKMNTK